MNDGEETPVTTPVVLTSASMVPPVCSICAAPVERGFEESLAALSRAWPLRRKIPSVADVERAREQVELLRALLAKAEGTLRFKADVVSEAEAELQEQRGSVDARLAAARGERDSLPSGSALKGPVKSSIDELLAEKRQLGKLTVDALIGGA